MWDMNLKARRLVTEFMKMDRIIRFGDCRCDLCDRITTKLDMHEIVSRNRTINNEELRKLTYAKEICGLLCGDCHLNKPVTSRDSQEKIFGVLIALYGVNRVRAALDKIPAQYLMNIYFPEE